MREQLCGNCFWFDVHLDDERGVGACRFYPPTPMVDVEGDLISAWPVVAAADNGCSKHSMVHEA